MKKLLFYALVLTLTVGSANAVSFFNGDDEGFSASYYMKKGKKGPEESVVQIPSGYRENIPLKNVMKEMRDGLAIGETDKLTFGVLKTDVGSYSKCKPSIIIKKEMTDADIEELDERYEVDWDGEKSIFRKRII